MAASEVPNISRPTPIPARVANHVKRVLKGSAPVTTNASTTTRATTDCSSEPPIGAPPCAPSRIRPSRAGSTRSRAIANTYRATELWMLIIAAMTDVMSSSSPSLETRTP